MIELSHDLVLTTCISSVLSIAVVSLCAIISGTVRRRRNERVMRDLLEVFTRFITHAEENSKKSYESSNALAKSIDKLVTEHKEITAAYVKYIDILEEEKKRVTKENLLLATENVALVKSNTSPKIEVNAQTK